MEPKALDHSTITFNAVFFRKYLLLYFLFQNELQKIGKVKVLQQNLPGGEQSIELVVFTNDYRSHVQCVMTEFNVPKRIIGITSFRNPLL